MIDELHNDSPTTEVPITPTSSSNGLDDGMSKFSHVSWLSNQLLFMQFNFFQFIFCIWLLKSIIHTGSSEEFVPATQDIMSTNTTGAEQIGNLLILFSCYHN